MLHRSFGQKQNSSQQEDIQQQSSETGYLLFYNSVTDDDEEKNGNFHNSTPQSNSLRARNIRVRTHSSMSSFHADQNGHERGSCGERSSPKMAGK
mmetsp:Transcript_27923/g.41537  ORF Transcript_27923/g.41537 Transcript_27923/m.41537 type:complete len:95 (+) Transcript_27923:38-322(+)